MSDSYKPCGGKNANICVAEGCYGEACLRLYRISGQKMNRFSGRDTPLFDFPVKNQKRFSGRFFGDLGIGFIYLMLVAIVLLSVAMLGGILVLGGLAWWSVFTEHTLWTTLITTGTLVVYAGCVVAARMERAKYERRRQG